MKKYVNRETVSFLLVGTINTVATYAIYLLLLLVFNYWGAYTGASAIGIFLSYSLNTLFVFRAKWSWGRLAAYPLVYVIQYALGMMSLGLLIEIAGVSEKIAPLFVVILTIPVTYLVSRRIIRGRNT